MTTELIEGFFSRFRGLMRAHGTYEVQRKNEAKRGKMEGRARTLQEPITPELWKAHLEGRRSLGVVPIDDAADCYFGAIDVDVYDLKLADVEKKIEALGLPLVVCRTKSGGAHLYIFGADPLPARILRPRLQEFAIALGFPGVEIFPKQIQLASPDDVGNWINLPYFGGDETDRFAIKDGERLSAAEFLTFAEAKAVTISGLKKIELPKVELLDEAPPCLEHFARSGFPEGTRNNGLFNLGVYAKKAFGDDWEGKLDELNRRFMSPPLGSKEVATTVASLKRKDYGFKCKDEPICSACNRSVCLTRKFGVGGGNEDPGVVFGGLTKIETAPPTWIVDVDGVRIELSETGDLLNQDRFRIFCVERLNRLPARVKGNAWEKIVQGMLERVELIEAPEDAGVEGQFFAMLEAFLTDRAQARNREELVLGKPLKEGGRYYFRSADLLKYLETNRFKGTGSARSIWSYLRKLGASHEQVNVKGKCLKLWSVPDNLFTSLEGDLAPARTAKKEEF